MRPDRNLTDPGPPLRKRRRGQRTVGCRARIATRTCSHRDDSLVVLEPDYVLGDRHGRRDTGSVIGNGKRWDRVDVSASVFRTECAPPKYARTPRTSPSSRARGHAFCPASSTWFATHEACLRVSCERTVGSTTVGCVPHGMRAEMRTDAAYLFKLTCACPRRRLDLFRDARNVLAC